MGILENKVAIVTGAGQGVGRGIALELAKEGASIVVVEINEETCLSTTKAIQALGIRAIGIKTDVRKRDQVNAAVEATIKEFGTVDILVNDAQKLWQGISFEDTTDEMMIVTWESGLMASFYFMQACFPYMKEHGGKIINLASGAGLSGAEGYTSYGCNKEAIRALTRHGAREWGKYKINVNVICPYALSPGLAEFKRVYPDLYDSYNATNPIPRAAECEEVGRVAVFLAGPDSDFITGHTVMVDGGQTVLR
jgi:NAD(P)-dependent dehydrogenase (short-subunit alcohol dehydrogenase family)